MGLGGGGGSAFTGGNVANKINPQGGMNSPYTNVRTVDIGGRGDYTSVKAACDFVATQSASLTSTWGILVTPGTYTEQPFTVPSYCSVCSLARHRDASYSGDVSGFAYIKLASGSYSGNFVTLQPYSSLEGMVVQTPGGLSPTGDFWVIGTDTGVGDCTLHDCYIHYQGVVGSATQLGLIHAQSYLLGITDCILKANVASGDITTWTSLLVEGNNAQVDMFGCIGWNANTGGGGTFMNSKGPLNQYISFTQLRQNGQISATGNTTDYNGSGTGTIGIFHCNAPARLGNVKTVTGFTSPWTRTVIVDNGGAGDYTSIASACSYVNGQSPSSTNLWNIVVMPGVYTENAFTVPTFTALKGIGFDWGMMTGNIAGGLPVIQNSALTTGTFITLGVAATIEGLICKSTASLTGNLVVVAGTSSSFVNHCIISFAGTLNGFVAKSLELSTNSQVTNCYLNSSGSVALRFVTGGCLASNCILNSSGSGNLLVQDSSSTCTLTHSRCGTGTGSGLANELVINAGTLVVNNTFFKTATGAGTLTVTDSLNPMAGGSKTFIASMGNIDNQFSTAGVGNGADNTDDTLFTLSLPINSLSANGKSIRVLADGTFAGNANTKQAKGWAGSTAISDSGVLTLSGKSWWMQLDITRIDATHIHTLGRFGGDTMSVQDVTVNANLVVSDLTANALIIKVTGASTGLTPAASDVLGYSMRTDFAN